MDEIRAFLGVNFEARSWHDNPIKEMTACTVVDLNFSGTFNWIEHPAKSVLRRTRALDESPV